MTASIVSNGGGRRLIVPFTANGTVSWGGYNSVDIILDKSSALAITLPAPVAGVDDGVRLRFISKNAVAHVTTCSDGFNAKGSSGTATQGGAIGDGFEVEAIDGHWYNCGKTNTTYA